MNKMNIFPDEKSRQENGKMFHVVTVDIPLEISQFLMSSLGVEISQINETQSYPLDKSEQKREEPVTRQEMLKRKNESKIKSDNSMMNTCYYLYWLLLNLNSSTEITLNGNKRVRSRNNRTKHYSCSSIKVNGTMIYKAETEYVIHEDPERHFPTIKIDHHTQAPVIKSEEKKKYKAGDCYRIQQHILIQTINNILKSYQCEISCYTKRESKTLVSFLFFSKYVDVNDSGQLVTKDILNEEFERLCETLSSVISFFLDKRSGLTRQLLISNEEAKDSCGLMQTNEKIIISRDRFLQVVWYMRKTGCSLSDVFLIQQLPINETKENDEK